MDETTIMRGKVSIVIPCYNGGSTLPETLASVERLPPGYLCDAIVVDDGSTDDETRRILDSLNTKRFRLIRTKNQGLGSARNTGIRASQGEFIIPLDSDNVLRESYLTVGVPQLIADPTIGVVYGNAEYIGDRSGPWIVPDFDLAKLVDGNFIDACALYRRAVWQDVGGYDEQMPAMGWEDWDFWIRCALRGWRFHHIAETAFEYRVRGGSMLQETNRHEQALLEYIFNKPGNEVARVLREQHQELQELRGIVASRSSRLGRAALAPARWLRDLIRE